MTIRSENSKIQLEIVLPRLYSAAFYTSFSMLNAPLNERIFAVTRAQGPRLSLVSQEAIAPPRDVEDVLWLDRFYFKGAGNASVSC